MTDPIADMLTRIRNAQLVKKSEVVMPYSKLKLSLLELLVKQGWLENVAKIEPSAADPKAKAKTGDITNRFASLSVKIGYRANGQPRITELIRISKPGRRVYVDKEHIPIVLSGQGISIISTSQGLLTDKDARAKRIGGEVICEIY